MNCIETTNLRYRFTESEYVLKDINLHVPTGSIYGFIGPNGSGKTTTLKLILGLLQKQEGGITIFNKNIVSNRVEILKKTGSLIEAPSIYAHLTARENLNVLRLIYQCPQSRVEDVLKIVGLSDTNNKKAGQFSLGMKQRLSIAIALLHSPALLILDEPTNGLDPNGILEIRELLKKLNKEFQLTILISSHALTEVEKLVTHVGIINEGSLLFQGTLKDLHQQQTMTSLVCFDTNNPLKTLEIILSNNLSAGSENGLVAMPFTDKETIAKITRQLVENHIHIYQIVTNKNDLESLALRL
jgi:ABC-type multidrug transport system ATPase subunit